MCDNKLQLNEQSSFIHDTTFIQNQRLLNDVSKQQEKQFGANNLIDGKPVEWTSNESFSTTELASIEALKNRIMHENISDDMKEFQQVYERIIKFYGVVSKERYNTLTKAEKQRYFG